jgi:methylase of polypeptide subunit release factors
LSAIPIAEQWDLVVGNSPFFDNAAFHLRAHDRGWHLHREFFATIARFLGPGGVIVLQENNLGSTAETFREMIETAGLSIVFVDRSAPQRTRHSRIYYIGIMRRGDVVGLLRRDVFQNVPNRDMQRIELARCLHKNK